MWKCDTCIHKAKLEDRKEICIGLCKDVFTRLNKENHKYQERISKPFCCGDCSYKLKIDSEDYYVCTVNTWDWEDRRVLYKMIRKNYLTRNTPKWCQL